MLIAQIANQFGAAAPAGIGLGSVIAIMCSWQRNSSIPWAIIAGMFSWVYVVYFVLTRRSGASNPPIPRYPLGVRRDKILPPPSQK